MPEAEQDNANESDDSNGDIRTHHPGGTMAADSIDEKDPHKAEKLSRLGSAGDEASEAAEQAE